MEWYTSMLLTFFMLILFLLSGIRIFIALILTGVVTIIWWMGFDQTEILAFASWGSLKSYGLAAIPLFVFMGDLIFRSGISHRIYSAVAPLMDRMPGGLLHSNIVAGALFAAASGSSLATTATIGTIALPEMKARGYHPHIMKGSILAGGCLGCRQAFYGWYHTRYCPRPFIHGLYLDYVDP
jgi:C4-dicarboxylate transporter DctM subunit